MYRCYGLRGAFITAKSVSTGSRQSRCYLHKTTFDGRNRLSNFWTPTVLPKKDGHEDSHDLLLRAGFLTQPHSGLFHLLPLGLRVQSKLERLIDKHMLSLGASKVSLSSLSSQALWQQSGRLEGKGSELFQLQDRKDAKYLLAPTHEEEITTIVGDSIKSYRDLPLRLYQVSRKYRDEARPRQGLLRGREFLMKDLYTFDVSEESARQTYEEVKQAYTAFLSELKLPYLVATADSGNMGGTLSHEFHFASENGEDTIIQCRNCDYSANEEVHATIHDPSSPQIPEDEISTLKTRTKSGQPVTISWPSSENLNHHLVKRLLPDIDLSSPFPGPTTSPTQPILHLIDPRLHSPTPSSSLILIPPTLNSHPIHLTTPSSSRPSPCPSCSHPSSLTTHRAIEIGHTFHLSTRYTHPLGVRILSQSNKSLTPSMGCHGIGVSRLIGAIAGILADEKGLNWPIGIAPFGVMVVATGKVGAEEVSGAYDLLVGGLGEEREGLDVAIDDREQALGWKLNDADLVGYPVIVVMGKGWTGEQKTVEVQCRRLGIKEQVPVGQLLEKIRGLAERL